MSKLFTATVAMQLAQDGTVSLERRVAALVPELEGSPLAKANATLRQLLSHSSGLPGEVDGAVSATQWNPMAETAFLASVYRAELVFEPGTRTSYSNSGMALAGLALSRAAQLEYGELVRTKLLDPLGMKSTSLRRPAEVAEDFEARVLGEPRRRTRPPSEMGAHAPAGQYYSNVDDLLAFAKMTLGLRPDVASRDALSGAFERQVPGSGNAIGWLVTEIAGSPAIGHAGQLDGFSSAIAVVPDEELAVVVLMSVGDFVRADCLARMVARRALGFATASDCFAPGQLSEDERAVALRLAGVFDAPSEEGLAAVFNESFLRAVGRQRFLKMLTMQRAMLGACKSVKIEREDRHAAHATVFCANTSIKLELVFDAALESRISVLRPR